MTALVAEAQPNVRLFRRAFDSHASQWSFAIEATDVSTEWILALDADYILSINFIDELKCLRPTSDVSAYWVSFQYCIHGKPLRGSLYPPVLALFRRGHGRYVQEGHTQRLQISGRSSRLTSKILHDDRKPIRRWLVSQRRYAQLEADHLLSAKRGQLDRVDRIRLFAWPAPILVFFYTLFVKGCVLDGWPGWLYSFQRCIAEAMIASAVLKRRFEARFGGGRNLTGRSTGGDG